MKIAMCVLGSVLLSSIVVGGGAYAIGNYVGEIDQDVCYSETLESIRSFAEQQQPSRSAVEYIHHK